MKFFLVRNTVKKIVIFDRYQWKTRAFEMQFQLIKVSVFINVCERSWRLLERRICLVCLVSAFVNILVYLNISANNFETARYCFLKIQHSWVSIWLFGFKINIYCKAVKLELQFSNTLDVSKLNKRCVTLPSVNCRRFAWEVVFWAILKEFEFPVYCSS